MQFIPPFIDALSLPEQERRSAGLISGSLTNLRGYHDDFVGALQLFNACSHQLEHKIGQRDLLIKWTLIACRDGAMTIYHFGKTLEHIRALFGPCPTLRKRTDHTKLRAATKLFEDNFPTFHHIRHAVAHTAELTKNIEAFEKNAYRGELRLGGISIGSHDGAFMLSGAVNGRSFTMTREGEILSYEISQKTADNLRSVVSEAFSAFESLAHNTEKA